jgi:hypothetical protein
MPFSPFASISSSLQHIEPDDSIQASVPNTFEHLMVLRTGMIFEIAGWTYLVASFSTSLLSTAEEECVVAISKIAMWIPTLPFLP